MIIRAIDSLGDWVYGKGKNDYNRGIDAVKTNVLTRLKSWRGDCFFALAEGVDYKNFLDVGTKEFLDRDIKRVILQTPDVIRITFFSSAINPDTRQYSGQCNIVTAFGIIQSFTF